MTPNLLGPQVKKLLLQKAAVFLYTPPREHFGIVPVEAMLCGTPVVAVNFGGPRESIQCGGVGQPSHMCAHSGACTWHNVAVRPTGEQEMQ